MTNVEPRTPEQFVQRLQSLVDGQEYRQAVAFAERFSPEFLSQLDAGELNRVTGMMEGVDLIVDLEDWQGGQSQHPGDAASGTPSPAGDMRHPAAATATSRTRVPRNA
jgi:hypothetical protein